MMKNVTKFLALLFIAALTLTAGISVYAEDPYTITVSNAVNGQTYTAYKIFSVTTSEKDGKTNYSYTATKTIKELVGTVEGVTFTQTTVADTFNVAVADANAAAALAVKLNSVKDQLGDSAGSATAQSKQAVITVSEPGYYFIDSSLGAVCSLGTASNPTPQATVEEKNPEPGIDKKIGENKTVESYDIGDTVPFTITVTPGGQADTSYIVHDTMSEGLTLDPDSFVVKMGDTEIDAANYTIKTADKTDPACTFEIEFYQTYTSTLTKEQKVVITYNAALNDKAVLGSEDPGNTNKVKLQYGDSYSTEVTVRVYTAEIVIDKRAENKTGAQLAGADFVLKNNEGQFYQYQNGDVTWVTEQKDATVMTTGADGAARFTGLKAGKYNLVEIKAPNGYNLLPNPVAVEITTEGAAAYANATETVVNNAGTELPTTGGTGTMLFVIFGALAVIGAGLFLVTNKRMSKENV